MNAARRVGGKAFSASREISRWFECALRLVKRSCDTAPSFCVADCRFLSFWNGVFVGHGGAWGHENRLGLGMLLGDRN